MVYLDLRNISRIDLVVWNIGDPILFQLFRLSFFNIRSLHVISALNLFVTSVGVCLCSIDVFDIELVVQKSFLVLVLDLRLDKVY